MGCTPSKVGQEPPAHQVGHGLHKGGEGQAREESRLAVPVVGHTERKRDKGRSRPTAQETQQSGGERRAQRGGEEKEGETVTDESGLQMRTPRTSAEPGLHHAAKNGDLPLVHRLLGHNIGGCESQTQDHTGGSIPDRDVSSTLVPDVDERGMWGNTPLLVATQYGHPEVALALIKGGAKACLENERRATALHFSCAEGFADVSQALLKNGADVDPPVAAIHHPGVNGGQIEPFTPLSAAAAGGHTELVRLLVEHGAEVNRAVVPKSTDGEHRRRGSFINTDGVGGSALTTAARQGHTEVCLVLVDSGASILFEDWDARTPLLHAILGGHEQTTMALLDSARLAECARQLAETCESDRGGAKASGLAPLHAACDNGMHTAVKALCATGADTEKKDSAGATPLLHACEKDQVECARELLSSGANPMVKDSTGNTPNSIARSRSDRPRRGELLKLIEAAVAGAEEREDQSGVKRNFQTAGDEDDRRRDNETDIAGAGDDLTVHSQGRQKGANEDADEDVLLVSDWDQNGEEEEDILDNGDIVDRPSSRSNQGNTDQSRCDSTAVDRPAVGIQEDDIREDGENDVLLVDDYDPDVEEGVEFVEMSSPVAMGNGDRKTQEHSTEANEDHKLPNRTMENAENGAKSDGRQSDASLEQNLVGQPKVGAEPVDTAMMAAADNVVGARPSGGG